ncbi:phage tail tape measure protein [Sodalis glossinidius]|uniref:phage tail tape measure protein n=1 Tax=Sodalis glossinidius TaxID=63612 RepID=UPI0002D4D9BC|nr:phage tail tape measure protein [Sodalis glossinidius]
MSLLPKEKKKLQAVAAQLYRHGISIRQSDNATAQLTRRTESYNRQLVAQQRHLSALTRMQASYARAKETRGKLAGRGADAMAAGGGELYASQRLLAPGRDFDAGMSSVQALTRLGYLDAGQMDRVSDVLTGAFTRTNTDLRQLGETMTYAGPMAADLGVSLESMAAMAEILKEARQALRTFDQPSQARLKKDLFGEEAMVGMGAVMEAAVNGKYDALFNALMHAGGETGRIAQPRGAAGNALQMGLSRGAARAGRGQRWPCWAMGSGRWPLRALVCCAMLPERGLPCWLRHWWPRAY